jgi:molecular chaperone GrpE (heat shock protein)
MNGRKWIRIKATEWESLNADMMDLRERAEKNAKLTEAWAEHAKECHLECKDAQAHIKELEADLERVRAELVEYKRLYADEVEKRVSFAILLKEGKEKNDE